MSTFHRSRLLDIRRPLINLHRALIDAAIVDHERVHGRVAEAQQRLDLVLEHSELAWLRPISALIVRIDEGLEDDAARLDGLLREVERLLAPADRDDELGRRYVQTLQAHPDVVMAHAQLRQAVEKGLLN